MPRNILIVAHAHDPWQCRKWAAWWHAQWRQHGDPVDRVSAYLEAQIEVERRKHGYTTGRD